MVQILRNMVQSTFVLFKVIFEVFQNWLEHSVSSRGEVLLLPLLRSALMIY